MGFPMPYSEFVEREKFLTNMIDKIINGLTYESFVDEVQKATYKNIKLIQERYSSYPTYAHYEMLEMIKADFSFDEDIYGKYKEAGFRHMKLDGRSFSVQNTVDSFVHYLVKPEFHEKIKGILYKEIYHQ